MNRLNRLDISAGAIFLFSAIYFFGGFTSLAALLIAVFVHELGHTAMILIFGGKIRRLNIGISGLCISYCGILRAAESAICLCAGPAMGFALALIASYFGNLYQNILLIKTAGFSFVLSVYNFLPALPLDGGRVLHCLLENAFDYDCAEKVLELTGLLTGAALLFSGTAFIRQSFGVALFIAGIWVLTAQTGIVKNKPML